MNVSHGKCSNWHPERASGHLALNSVSPAPGSFSLSYCACLSHIKEWCHEEQQSLFLHVSTFPFLCPQELPTPIREHWVLLLLSHTSDHANNATSPALKASFLQGIRQSDRLNSRKHKRKALVAWTYFFSPGRHMNYGPDSRLRSISVTRICLPLIIHPGCWFSSCSECGGI